MVFNTLTVGAAVTPSVIETYFSHYLNRAPLRHKPTAHISYHEGLRLIREFLEYSSKHTVEDLQAFTGQWVPAPHWIRTSDVHIGTDRLERAAQLIQAQLGPRGLELVGGKTWWQWRRPESPLMAEWIEMKKDQQERARSGAACQRVMLYVHGGAYYFGSVYEHRYQMQRHARKLKARVLTPKYRLAPQFPFPCGLCDCLATYLHLLDHFEPGQILLAGDSAGGGMVLSMLVILRDQGQPLPAGAILLSPWVDLTHSFPSVAGDGAGDYIPPHGFHHRPSMAWPPPSDSVAPNVNPISPVSDDAVELPATAGPDMSQHQTRKGIADNRDDDGDDDDDQTVSALPPVKPSKSSRAPSQFGGSLRIELDGQSTELKEQIQLYTTNQLLAHPLVSPVMQPSLGGLPPMLIQTGGAELLKDEQVYLAHKAANPIAYPPNEITMSEFDPRRESLKKWPPTNVQLQLWEDLCHVPHTLSFTRPAKYMYRSVAQFGAWALAHAQKQSINIQNDDAVSFISSGGDEEEDEESSLDQTSNQNAKASISVGKAGDPLPHFKDHMIRQRVTRHGVIYSLAPASEMACLALDPESIGVPKPGPVRKWLATHHANEQKFANDRKKIDKKRGRESSAGYDEISGERPPPTALVNRRRNGVAPEEKKRGRSWGLTMWSGWGSSHDEQTLQREQKTERDALRKASASSALDLTASNTHLAPPEHEGKRRRASSSGPIASRLQIRSTSSRDGRREDRSTNALPTPEPFEQQVSDEGQAGEENMGAERDKPLAARPLSDSANSPIPIDTTIGQSKRPERHSSEAPIALIPTTSMISPRSERIAGTDNTFLSPSGSRPHNGVQAYPFKLKDFSERDASTLTLDSLVPAAQIGPGGSTAHSELMGDAPGPVELPSGLEIVRDYPNNRNEIGHRSPGDQYEPPFAASGMDHSSASHSSYGNPIGNAATEPIVSPIRSTEISKDETPVTPVEQSTASTVPFKIRNPVFDNRTSMLGSIGPDGMPNSHYAFLRHTVYEPDVTLGPSQVSDHSAIPEHSTFEPSDQKISDTRSKREGGAPGVLTKPKLNRSVMGGSSDEVDKPPPPPPKDESYVRASSNSTRLNQLETNGAALEADNGPPAIGTLGFEKAYSGRTALETFVTARDDTGQ